MNKAGLEGRLLLVVDPVSERRVDDDGQLDVLAVLVQEGTHRFVELFEARCGASLRGDVGSVDHDVFHIHAAPSQAEVAPPPRDRSASTARDARLPSAA